MLEERCDLTLSSVNKEKEKEATWRDFFEIQTIRDGVLVLDLRRYRKLVEINTIPLSHCSENELESLYLGWKYFCHRLDSNKIALYIQSRQVDLEAHRKEVDRARKIAVERFDGNESLDNWLLLQQDFDASLLESRELPVRRNFLIFMEDGTEKDPEVDFTRAQERLNDRIRATLPLVRPFARENKVLDTPAALDVLHAWANKTHSKFFSGAAFHEQGFFQKWVSGVNIQ